MSAQHDFSLLVDEFKTFCDQLIQRSSDPAKKQYALVTLQAFVRLLVSRQSADGTAGHDIQAYINRLVDEARINYIDEQADSLLEALIKKDITALADIHQNMSRNGFHKMLQDVLIRISPSELMPIANWCHQWLIDARARAEAASGYPEAYDFRKAQIDMHQYQAVEDLSICLPSG